MNKRKITFKDKEKAIETVKRRNRILGKENYICLAVKNGYLVVSKKRFKEIRGLTNSDKVK